MNFFIKPQYIPRLQPKCCSRVGKDASRFQAEIYAMATAILAENKLSHILDIGCGAAEKLVKINANITGIDIGDNCEICQSNYPQHSWINLDLNEPHEITCADNALVICIDVIEHIPNPHYLLTSISKLCNAHTILISTPERDLVHGIDHNGPPVNSTHVREWNKIEFKQLLNSYNLNATIELVNETMVALIRN